MARTGRPSGQFQGQAERLYQMLTKMQPSAQQGWLLPNNEYWASRLDRSPTQVSRYFSALHKQGKIKLQEQNFPFSTGKRSWSNRRIVVVKEAP